MTWCRFCPLSAVCLAEPGGPAEQTILWHLEPLAKAGTMPVQCKPWKTRQTPAGPVPLVSVFRVPRRLVE